MAKSIDHTGRSMITALAARRPERARGAYHLFDATPALQARIHQLVWRDQEHVVEALLTGVPRTPEAEFRARVITHAVTGTIRVAVVAWIQSGQRSTVVAHCEQALTFLREEFAH
ncbi:hypothetical protein [Nonomuraea sp. NPDC001699]